jgi:hypothetical protein
MADDSLRHAGHEQVLAVFAKLGGDELRFRPRRLCRELTRP